MKLAILGDGLLARSIADNIAGPYDDTRPVVTGYVLGHDAFDITSLDSIVAALTPIEPDVIVNTVAYHRLAECERNPNLAWDINARGAERVAQLAPTIYVSTDYVFSDGGPHDESMPGLRPLSEYGRSKMAGELATLEKDGIVVRVSALYGHHKSHKGPTFPETILSSWDTLRLPNDQRFSPTYAPDAAERIVQLALDGKSGIYHAANSGSTTWAEFGQEIAEVTRRRRHIVPYAAKDPLRPRNSALRSTRLPPLRHWRIALSDWALRYESDLRDNAVSPLRGA